MKYSGLRWGFAAFGCMTLAMSALSTSYADNLSFLNMGAETTVSSGSAGTAVGMNAEFLTAATFKIEHEPMTMQKRAAGFNINNIVTHEAYVTIGGLPGETVLLTCNVASHRDAGNGVRDCGGDPVVKQHAILSGEKLDNGVVLTDDLMPNDSGKSESTVTFEVSYP